MSISILLTIQNHLNFYGYVVPMVLGNIGNTFIVILLSRQRQNPCTIYLISSAIVNNIYLIFVGYAQMFPFDYGDQTMRVLILCKIRSYFPSVLGLLTKTLIALACIDRYLITSNRASFRNFSTPKRAKHCIMFSILFWPLFCIHIGIMTTIIEGKCDQFGIYSVIFSIYIMIFVGLVPPIILSTFGYLTYRNIRHIYIRVQPVVHNIVIGRIPIRRRDRELFIIVLFEIIVYVITAIPYPCILLEMMINHYIIFNTNAQYFQIENFLRNMALFLLYLNFATPFYIYVISSKAFRHDFKQLIKTLHRKLTRQTIIPIVQHIANYREAQVQRRVS